MQPCPPRPAGGQRAETPRQESQRCNKLGEYDAAVAQARPPHRRRARSSCLRAYRRRRHRRAHHARHTCTTAVHACPDRVLRRTPTHPRHDVRVALQPICCCHRTAEDRACTYALPRTVRGERRTPEHGHVARDAIRVWPRAHSAVSRACRCRPNSSVRRRPRCAALRPHARSSEYLEYPVGASPSVRTLVPVST